MRRDEEAWRVITAGAHAASTANTRQSERLYVGPSLQLRWAAAKQKPGSYSEDMCDTRIRQVVGRSCNKVAVGGAADDAFVRCSQFPEPLLTVEKDFGRGLPAGGGRARGAAGQRPRREERPGPGEDGQLDAVWLAKLTEKGLLRPSFVPPTEIRRLRDYTRLRADLTHDRSRQVQRLEKLLEDALVKLSTVATDIMGVSGRAMIEALIAGQRDAKVLAGLARGRMKTKRAALIEALSGRFDDHHAELARMLLDQIDALTAQIDTLTARIEQLLAAMPEAQPVDPRRDGPASGHPVGVTADTLAECARLTTVERLDEIAGIGEHNAQVIIAEIGLDMSRFPNPAHLVSWAKLCPRTIQSGPVTRGGRTGKGNPYLKGVLGDAAAAAAKTSTFLGERYRRIVKRRGKLKALVAVARSILVIVWNLLNDPTARFHDLGPDYHTNRIATERRMRNHIAQLTAMGYRVTLEPAA